MHYRTGARISFRPRPGGGHKASVEPPTVVLSASEVRHIALSASAVANAVSECLGSLLTQGASMSATMGSYRRRKDEWTHREDLASLETDRK